MINTTNLPEINWNELNTPEATSELGLVEFFEIDCDELEFPNLIKVTIKPPKRVRKNNLVPIKVKLTRNITRTFNEVIENLSYTLNQQVEDEEWEHSGFTNIYQCFKFYGVDDLDDWYDNLLEGCKYMSYIRFDDINVKREDVISDIKKLQKNYSKNTIINEILSRFPKKKQF